MNNINIHSFSYVNSEHLYGPGERLILWLQGCSIHCPGCVNHHLWPFSKNTLIDEHTFLKMIKMRDIDGVTLHGGEPLDQSKNLLKMVKITKELGKTIILFTGYDFKQLNTKEQRDIWYLSDIVVAGPYVESKQNLYLQFRGSTNQKVITHKGKYKNYKITDGKTESILTLDGIGNYSLKGFLSEDIKGIIKFKE